MCFESSQRFRPNFCCGLRISRWPNFLLPPLLTLLLVTPTFRPIFVNRLSIIILRQEILLSSLISFNTPLLTIWLLFNYTIC